MQLCVLLLALCCCYGGVCASQTTKVPDLGDLADKVRILDQEISGEDLINDFKLRNLSLVARGVAKDWPLYKALRDRDQFDAQLKDVKVHAAMVHHDNYGGGESSIGEFVSGALAGTAFQLEIDEDLALAEMIPLPFMVSSCKKMERDFVTSGKALLSGTKTKIYNEGLGRCLTSDLLIAVMSGRAKLSFYGKKSVFVVHSGDLVYIPRSQCFRFRSTGVFLAVQLSWTNNVTDSAECARRSVYDVTKDLPVDPIEAERMARDHTWPDLELNTGHKMPPIGLGTARLLGKSYEAVKTALEIGYRLFDTAQIYSGEDKWENFEICSEQEIGRALLDSGVKREEVFIVTKLADDFGNKENALKTLDRSLQHLGTDYVDVALVHEFSDENCQPENDKGKCAGSSWQGWRALEEMKASGKARSIGVSNVNRQALERLLDVAKQPVSVVQNWFDPLHQDREVRELCRQKGIAYMGYGNFGFVWMEELGLEENPVLNEPAIVSVATDYDLPRTSVILRWAMQRGVVVIPSAKDPVKMAKNLNSRKEFVLEGSAKVLDQLDGLHGDPTQPGWKRPRQSEKDLKDEL